MQAQPTGLPASSAKEVGRLSRRDIDEINGMSRIPQVARALKLLLDHSMASGLQLRHRSGDDVDVNPAWLEHFQETWLPLLRGMYRHLIIMGFCVVRLVTQRTALGKKLEGVLGDDVQVPVLLAAGTYDMILMRSRYGTDSLSVEQPDAEVALTKNNTVVFVNHDSMPSYDMKQQKVVFNTDIASLAGEWNRMRQTREYQFNAMRELAAPSCLATARVLGVDGALQPRPSAQFGSSTAEALLGDAGTQRFTPSEQTQAALVLSRLRRQVANVDYASMAEQRQRRAQSLVEYTKQQTHTNPLSTRQRLADADSKVLGTAAIVDRVFMDVPENVDVTAAPAPVLSAAAHAALEERWRRRLIEAVGVPAELFERQTQRTEGTTSLARRLFNDSVSAVVRDLNHLAAHLYSRVYGSIEARLAESAEQAAEQVDDPETRDVLITESMGFEIILEGKYLTDFHEMLQLSALDLVDPAIMARQLIHTTGLPDSLLRPDFEGTSLKRTATQRALDDDTTDAPGPRKRARTTRNEA